MRLLPNTRNRRRVLRKKLDVLKEPCVNQATKKQVYICLCSSLHFYVEVIVRLHHRVSVSNSDVAIEVTATAPSSQAPASGKICQRRKDRRAFPLRVKNSDPAMCLDLIDDMYEHYFNLEVRSNYLVHTQF